MEKKTMDLGFVEFLLFGLSVMGIYLVSRNLILSAIMLVVLALFFGFDGFTRGLKVVVTIILFIILAIILFCGRTPKQDYKPLPDNNIVDKDIEEKDEKEKSEEQDNPQLESNKITTGNIYTTRNPQRGTSTPTFGGKTATNGQIPDIGIETHFTGPSSFTLNSPAAEEYKKQQDKEIQDLKDQGYNVEPLPNGIVVLTKPSDDTTQKEEEKNYDDVKELTDEELEEKLASQKPNQTTSTEKQNEANNNVNNNQSNNDVAQMKLSNQKKLQNQLSNQNKKLNNQKGKSQVCNQQCQKNLA